MSFDKTVERLLKELSVAKAEAERIEFVKMAFIAHIVKDPDPASAIRNAQIDWDLWITVRGQL